MSSAVNAVPTREELFGRARALAPILSDRSAHCEELRRVPDETIADFVAQGLLRLSQPARYGGYELGWDVVCELGQTLARGCGSQSWVQLILNSHARLGFVCA